MSTCATCKDTDCLDQGLDRQGCAEWTNETPEPEDDAIERVSVENGHLRAYIEQVEERLVHLEQWQARVQRGVCNPGEPGERP
jgi:hypothetical protein